LDRARLLAAWLLAASKSLQSPQIAKLFLKNRVGTCAGFDSPRRPANNTSRCSGARPDARSVYDGWDDWVKLPAQAIAAQKLRKNKVESASASRQKNFKHFFAT
jgi:hypothetical protein